MTKFAIYRNNSAYEQFLTPVISERQDFELKVFAQGTEEKEISGWISENAEKIRGMEHVFMDKTCYEAGEKVPSIKVEYKNWSIWMDVKTNCGGFDYNVFQKAATDLLQKGSPEETIAEVVRHMLAKEMPTKVLVIRGHMGDHNLFNDTSEDYNRMLRESVDSEKLRKLLEGVIGQPVTYLKVGFSGIETEVPVTDSDTAWVFLDRHFPSSKEWEWRSIPPAFRQFRVPVENLIGDAVAFGIELDEEKYSRAIREIVMAW